MRVLVVLTLLAAAVAGCGGEAERGAPRTPVPAPADTAPAADDALAGTTLEGESLGLDRFRGEYLFVNVWSSW